MIVCYAYIVGLFSAKKMARKRCGLAQEGKEVEKMKKQTRCSTLCGVVPTKRVAHMHAGQRVLQYHKKNSAQNLRRDSERKKSGNSDERAASRIVQAQ